MKDSQNLTDEILSQIQTGEDLKQFLTHIQKRGWKSYWKASLPPIWGMTKTKRVLHPMVVMATAAKK